MKKYIVTFSAFSENNESGYQPGYYQGFVEAKLGLKLDEPRTLEQAKKLAEKASGAWNADEHGVYAIFEVSSIDE